MSLQWKPKELSASMDNVYASRLGTIADVAGQSEVGDSIDRGLILLRLLNQNGFTLQANHPVMQMPDFNADLTV